MNHLKEKLAGLIHALPERHPFQPFYHFSEVEKQVLKNMNGFSGSESDYQKILLAHHSNWLAFLDQDQRKKLKAAADLAPPDRVPRRRHARAPRLHRRPR